MIEAAYTTIPLYQTPDYRYYVSLEKVSYQIRFYYNERAERWIVDLSYSSGEPIVLGAALVSQYPMFYDYDLDMNGFFWLEPIGKSKNETISNPYEIDKYYRLYYVFPNTEEE